MSAHLEPGVLSTARKAVVSALVAFTVAGGVILAAVADDRVTATEWVTIALALAGGIVGPAGVYATRNAQVAPQPVDAPPTTYGGPVRQMWNEQVGPPRPDHFGHAAPAAPDRDSRPWTTPEG